jgi:hypothetical protein
MRHARLMPSIGPRCYELRINDVIRRDALYMISKDVRSLCLCFVRAHHDKECKNRYDFFNGPILIGIFILTYWINTIFFDSKKSPACKRQK